MNDHDRTVIVRHFVDGFTERITATEALMRLSGHLDAVPHFLEHGESKDPYASYRVCGKVLEETK